MTSNSGTAVTQRFGVVLLVGKMILEDLCCCLLLGWCVVRVDEVARSSKFLILLSVSGIVHLSSIGTEQTALSGCLNGSKQMY